MQWIDVFGPPGVGKSTLVDGFWPPRCIKNIDAKPPAEWAAFIKCMSRMREATKHHATFKACDNMVKRNFRKMISVNALRSNKVYIQTGFAQRGLGFGWRLKDPESIAEYYRLMPISLGVIQLKADIDTVKRRNVERGKDRSHMVQPMARPMQIAAEILRERGLPFLELDTLEPVNDNIRAIVDFAKRVSGNSDASAFRHSCKS